MKAGKSEKGREIKGIVLIILKKETNKGDTGKKKISKEKRRKIEEPKEMWCETEKKKE